MSKQNERLIEGNIFDYKIDIDIVCIDISEYNFKSITLGSITRYKFKTNTYKNTLWKQLINYFIEFYYTEH